MDGWDPNDALALLAWQVELGADEAILDAPVNRFESAEAPPVERAAPVSVPASVMPVAPASQPVSTPADATKSTEASQPVSTPADATKSTEVAGAGQHGLG
ncbi:MAG: hypothetical protein ACTS11_05530, partial [Roseicyclus sp.]